MEKRSTGRHTGDDGDHDVHQNSSPPSSHPICRRRSIMGSLLSRRLMGYTRPLLSINEKTPPWTTSMVMITPPCSTSGIVPGIAIPDEYIEQPHPVSFSMRRSRRLRLSYHAITDVRWILAGADAGVEPRTQLSVSAPVVKGAQCSTKAGRTQ